LEQLVKNAAETRNAERTINLTIRFNAAPKETHFCCSAERMQEIPRTSTGTVTGRG